MNYWKIILEENNVIIELIIKAKFYSDAYIKAETLHPNCRLISIKPYKKGKNKPK